MERSIQPFHYFKCLFNKSAPLCNSKLKSCSFNQFDIFTNIIWPSVVSRILSSSCILYFIGVITRNGKTYQARCTPVPEMWLFLQCDMSCWVFLPFSIFALHLNLKKKVYLYCYIAVKTPFGIVPNYYPVVIML